MKQRYSKPSVKTQHFPGLVQEPHVSGLADLAMRLEEKALRLVLAGIMATHILGSLDEAR